MFRKILMTTAAIGALTTFTATATLAHDHMAKDDGAHAEATVEKDIVATASENEQFSSLVAALKAADLVSALQGEGPFTVFAPTDEAFAKLPEGTVESLLLPENKEKLQSILKYHVVPSSIMSGDIADGTSDVTTLEGSDVTVTKSDAGVLVGGANVTSADIKTTNGVIHVIDTVILPE